MSVGLAERRSRGSLAILTTPGEAAYVQPAEGSSGIGYHDRWFIRYRHQPTPTAIWLYDGQGVPAARQGGPAKLP